MLDTVITLPSFGKIKLMAHNHECLTGRKYQSFLQQIFVDQFPCTGHSSQESRIQNNEVRWLWQTREFLPSLNALHLFIYFKQVKQAKLVTSSFDLS